MSAAVTLTGAWGGDPARKQAAIQAARQALDAGGEISLYPRLELAPPEHPDRASNVYCLAYGTGVQERCRYPDFLSHLPDGPWLSHARRQLHVRLELLVLT